MSDKDISKMDYKELRNEVQLLRDELAIFKRKYEDFYNNLKYEIPIIDGKHTITHDLVLTGKVTWKMQNSPVKTQYSVDGNTWHDEQVSGYRYMRMSFDGGQTWTEATKVVGKDGSNASVTFAKVNAVLGNLFKEWESGKPTEINGYRIYSPQIEGGRIYGTVIYAGTGNGSYAEMTGTGLDVYVQDVNDKWANKIGIGYYRGNYDYPYITLGAGTNEARADTGCIYKLSEGLWIGDASIIEDGGKYPGNMDTVSDISSTNKQATGIFIDFKNEKIYQYIKGVPSEIGSGGGSSTATFG